MNGAVPRGPLICFMRVFCVDGRLYWPDGEQISAHVRLMDEIEIVDLDRIEDIIGYESHFPE
jgi:hypothetical protein